MGNSPSTATLQTGWGVLTHKDLKHGACSQGTQLLLSGSGELWHCSGVCVCVCVCVCVHAPVGTGAHTGVHVFRVCVCTDVCVCVCVCVHSSREQCL